MKNAAAIPCQSTAPYPPVRVERLNLRYARAMLDNLGGNLSEMSAVSRYFYDHLATLRYEQIADAFHRISIVEMHHLEIFGKLAMQLGEDPRLWAQCGNQKTYWSPAYNTYSGRLPELLNESIQKERGTIEKYLKQMEWIADPNIQENLMRIIEDERIHVEVLSHLCDTVC